MTRAEAIAAAPFSRRAYILDVLLCLGLMGVCAWALVAKHGSSLALSASIGVMLLCLAGFLFVVCERLMFPRRAAQRAAGWSESTRAQIHAIAAVGYWLSAGCFMACTVAWLIGSKNSAAWTGSVVLGIGATLRMIVLDITWVPGMEDDLEHSPPLLDLKPLASDGWGEAK